MSENSRPERGSIPPDPLTAAVLDTVHDGVVVVGADGVVLRVNQAVPRILGYAPEELIGRPVSVLMPEPDASSHEAHMRRYLETGESRIIGRGRDVEARHKDGSRVWVSLAISEFRVGDERFFCGTLRDITAQRNAEAQREAALHVLEFANAQLSSVVAEQTRELARSESFLRNTLDALSAHICIVDERGKVVATNRAWEDFARANQGLAGPGGDYQRTLERSIAAGDRDARAVDLGLRRVVSGELQEFLHEYPCHSPSEERWFSLRATRFVCERGQHLVLAHENVTARRQSQDQLRHAQKLDAVGQLAGGIAHDFNNLLTAVRYHASFVLEALKPGDPVTAEVKMIEQVAERATDLAGQLLVFSRRKVTAPEVVRLGRAVSEFVPTLRRLLGSRVTLTTHIGAGPDHVLIDRGQLHQVIANLVLNARDATPDDGEIVVRTQTTTDASGIDHVQLEVVDKGVGMSDDVRERVFEPFFTTKPAGRGTGLGLSIVYGIVTDAKGTVDLTSRAGEGTTVRVSLPRTPAITTPSQGVARAHEAPPVDVTVLVVEDDEVLRRATCRGLSRAGFRVVSAEDGGQALEILSAPNEPIHAVVSDVSMPGMSGLDLARRIRTKWPSVAILLVTGATAPGVSQDDFAGYDVLPKPFSPRDLEARLRQVLHAARTERTT